MDVLLWPDADGPGLGHMQRVAAESEHIARAVVWVGGGEASHSYYPYLASEALARRVGAPVVEFPGGHIGPTSDPIEFASRLGEVL